ncbi:SDR family NAD(P)-dependent oxidoreductase [Clostridium sp. Marseille-P2415]|uniref:SDR family NAD(P)-dependent oxidoreductase n=1 Tax=Clostridium sp. Marseille-P2415 TaxID=1805471 RepID=UPI0009884C6F|nr:glucose 1-dehydrogenase [Clostridium sp. Marseille-P2415]
MKLSGKVALITGAASGMGKAQALLFAENGAKVIAADINLEGVTNVANEISSKGGKALAVQVNLTDLNSIKEMVRSGQEEFGQIDIVSNTAGIYDYCAPSLETSEEAWDRLMDVNVKAPYRISNLILPQMIERGKGVIINIASCSGLLAGGGGAGYTASKHAVIGYTKQLSCDYGPKGIKVNAICPGLIETPMVTPMINGEAGEAAGEAIMAQVRATPAQRFAQPVEVAQLALFLASEDSDFIHGSAVVIDGGYTIK